jgi:hypothetical protein
MPQKPVSRLGFQEPKSNKLTTFTYMNLRGEFKLMHQMQWQEHTRCSNRSFPKSYQINKCHGEIWEEEQEVNPQITLRSRSNRFLSHRGDIDWWKCRSRSPLTFPSRLSKNHGRERERESKASRSTMEERKKSLKHLPLGNKGALYRPPTKTSRYSVFTRIIRSPRRNVHPPYWSHAQKSLAEIQGPDYSNNPHPCNPDYPAWKK